MEDQKINDFADLAKNQDHRQLAEGMQEVLEFVLNPANYPGTDYLSFSRPMATAVNFLQQGIGILR